MSWQAFSWSEIQARSPRLPERFWPSFTLATTQVIEALSLFAVFLTPFAFLEAALGSWRLAADLGWAGAFFINTGVLSHWQVWFALSAFTQVTSVYLNRLLATHTESAVEQK
jgi:hypothetical protein